MRKKIITLILILFLIAECLVVYTYADNELSAGDTVYFGSYEQDNDTANGAERIKWRVLKTDGDTALLISCWILDISQYNSSSGSTTWEKCYLRDWLNSYFYESAFTDTEKSYIADSNVAADPNPKYSTDCGNDTVDKVYLLSYDEARTYLDYSVGGAERYEAADEVVHPDLMAFFTPYALAKGAHVQEKYNSGVWWLRTQGYTGGEACNVSWAGFISSYGHYVTMSTYGVRPSIRVKISALEKTEADRYPDYAAGSGDEPSEEPSSPAESSEAQSSEITSTEQSEVQSKEESERSSEESTPAYSEETSAPSESSQDPELSGQSSEAGKDSVSSEGPNRLEDSGTVSNKYKIIGVLICVLAGLLIFKIVYNNILRKRRY